MYTLTPVSEGFSSWSPACLCRQALLLPTLLSVARGRDPLRWSARVILLREGTLNLFFPFQNKS